MNKSHLIVGSILLALVVLVGVNAIIIPSLVMRSEPAVSMPAPVAETVLDGSIPSCDFCVTDMIKSDEIAQYIEVAMATGLTDQQIRSLDIGRSNVQVALAHRGPLSEPLPRSVAVHNLVTEVYVVLSGSGTNITGPDLVAPEPRPDDYRAVVYLNGPGQTAESIRNGTEVELEAGDVFVIPAGTGHQFTRIDDHITYLMIRIDPDKVVPLLTESESQDYLEENLP
jgi:mannose-6-phosphate isomerase-like protein (cupin superfamily)